jgi:malate dehydrogenase (oxaloacetate-decarboxylating)
MADNKTNEESLDLHEKFKGKIAVKSKVPLERKKDLTLAYTPGVAEPCRRIASNPADVYKYTSKWNTVAVVSDGSAVLGLGNIGGKASIPVMEGKAVLFKRFADIDAFPICLETQDSGEIVDIIKNISPVFGGINLEDITAPRCFEIEARLKKELDIPVFHDDQHGTAVVVLAALKNALRVVGKGLPDVKIVLSGAGAAGHAVTRFLLNAGAAKGAGNVRICDSKGIIHKGMEGINPSKGELAEWTGCTQGGSLADAMKGADVFIGVSAPGTVARDMVKGMEKDAVVLAMANPVPEIMPDLAKAAGARVVATGRSDFPNQVNNLLGFPGIFRGALDARAKAITEPMKIAAAEALAGLVPEPSEENIIPSPLDRRVVPAVAEAVKKAAGE